MRSLPQSGAHERFIGFLIELYAGSFLLWLAPDQVRTSSLNDDEALIAYAKPKAEVVADILASIRGRRA